MGGEMQTAHLIRFSPAAASEEEKHHQRFRPKKEGKGIGEEEEVEEEGEEGKGGGGRGKKSVGTDPPKTSIVSGARERKLEKIFFFSSFSVVSPSLCSADESLSLMCAIDWSTPFRRAAGGRIIFDRKKGREKTGCVYAPRMTTI